MDPDSKSIENHNDSAITENGEAPEKIAKIETNVESSSKANTVKRRSKKAEEDLMAEARAISGSDIDSSEGRRLRKRTDPPPKPAVEEKKKVTPKRQYKKKAEEPAAMTENGDESKTSDDANGKDETGLVSEETEKPEAADIADTAIVTTNNEHKVEENGTIKAGDEESEDAVTAVGVVESTELTKDDQVPQSTE